MYTYCCIFFLYICIDICQSAVGSFVVFHFAFTIIKKEQIKHKNIWNNFVGELKPKNTFN